MLQRRCRILNGLRPSAVLMASGLCLSLSSLVEPVAAAPLVPGDSTKAARAAMRTRLYVGMWSTHLHDLNRGLGANSLIGFAYRGYFGATFINSFGDRALSLGVQRSFSPARSGTLTTALGYRAGLITGYDERFFGIGDKLPVLPFAQFVAGVDVRNLGIELAYAGIVASVSLNWRL